MVSSPFLCLVEEMAFDLFFQLPIRLRCSDCSSLHTEEWVSLFFECWWAPKAQAIRMRPIACEEMA